MTIVKVFNAKIEDGYGDSWPNAVVAIRAFSETSQTTGLSGDCASDYDVKQVLDAITYKLSYWSDQSKKAQGKRSRPLLVDDGSALTDSLEVDMDHPQVEQIINSAGESVDKILRVIEADIRRKFK